MEPNLAPMIEDEGAEASMDELLCPICLDLLHRPHSLQPCQHLFCDPCLRRLAGARIHKCPVCRSPIEVISIKSFMIPLKTSTRMRISKDKKPRWPLAYIMSHYLLSCLLCVALLRSFSMNRENGHWTNSYC
jgi:hypothetical protein